MYNRSHNRNKLLSIIYFTLVVLSIIVLSIVVNVKRLNKTTPEKSLAAGISTSITRKVLVLNFDPYITGTTPLHTYNNWGDPTVLQTQHIADIKNASQNYLNFQIVQNQTIRDYPTKIGGYKFTNNDYLGCVTSSSASYCNQFIDYNKIITDYNICGQVNSGTIDEVWLWGGPYFGYQEAVMAGPGAFNLNGGPLTNTTCNRKVAIMGFNYERTNREMAHSFAHRVEGVMVKVSGGHHPYAASTYDINNMWDRFWLHNSIAPGKASCGQIHQPPNGSVGQFNSPTNVASVCDDWLNYPSTTGRANQINCNNWGCVTSGTNFMEKWWLTHLPNKTGTTNNKLNNWWAYVADYDAAVARESQEEEKWYSITSGSLDYNTGCRTTTNGNEIYLGQDSSCSGGKYTANFDFVNVQIPTGNSVTEAYIEFVTDGPYSNALNEGIVVSDGTTTSTQSTWNISSSWTLQNITRSPNIASQIQQLVSASSWAPGKTIKVKINHLSGTGSRRVIANEREPLAGAKLIVNTRRLPRYCPSASVTRDQMAVFLLKTKHGSTYSPPAVGSSTGFSDVPISHWAAPWIKQVAVEGITSGCGSGNYCPSASVTRDQMAVFLLKTKYGGSYSPPNATGAIFADIPQSYWAASWIEQVYRLNISSGCGY